MKAKTKWVTTREPNLLKNAASGRFYGRFNVSGKQKWVNLDADKFSVAKLRLADERVKTERGRLAKKKNVASGTGAMGEIAEIFLTRLVADRAIKRITRTRYQIVLAALRRTPIEALALPRTVLEKSYHQNSLRLVPLLNNRN